MPSALRTVLFACLALLALAAGPANAAEKGVVPDLTWGTSTSDQDRTGAMMQSAGAKWARLNISWRQVNPSPGSYSASKWSHYDRAIDTARAAGSKVILMVQQAPQWASGSSAEEAVPRDPADYANFLRVLLQRYPGKVEALEVWNEENTSRFWPTGVNAAQYALLLKAAHGAVKSVNPNVRVVFGGLWENDWGFVEAAYASMPDLGRYFDVMALHPYTSYGGPPETVNRAGNGRITYSSFAGYREVRQTMLARGDVKPIWFTEFGWATYTGTSGVSEETQAAYLTRALRCVEQDPYVEVATWYNLRNNYWAGNANTWEDQLGLLRTNYSAKPAYGAFSAYSPGTGGCAYQDAAGRGGAPGSGPVTATASTASGRRRATSARITRVRLARVPTAGAARRRARRAPLARTAVSVYGLIRGAAGTRITIRFQHRRSSRRAWRTVRLRTTRIGAGGRFSFRLPGLLSGSWRVRAEYRGSPTDLPTRSPFSQFRVG